jgi:hypothetical protein
MKGERKYWPTEWVDDPLPPGLASPSDFIVDCGEGIYFLGYPLDARDVSEFQKRFYNSGVDPDDTVEFTSADDLGSIDVTILPDGDVRDPPEIPEAATVFWSGSIHGVSLGEFVSIWCEIRGERTEPETVIVSMAAWSEGVPHQFMPPIEGKVGPQFVSLKMESETVQ